MKGEGEYHIVWHILTCSANPNGPDILAVSDPCCIQRRRLTGSPGDRETRLAYFTFL